MKFNEVKSFAKINLALNITGKNSILHKIETIVAFTSLYDRILIKKTKFKKHKIVFFGKFSKGINRNNTVFRLLERLGFVLLPNNKGTNPIPSGTLGISAMKSNNISLHCQLFSFFIVNPIKTNNIRPRKPSSYINTPIKDCILFVTPTFE